MGGVGILFQCIPEGVLDVGEVDDIGDKGL